MESIRGLSYTTGGGGAKFTQFDPFPASTNHNDSSTTQSNGNFKHGENFHHHHRSSSEGFLFDETPSWLDDLLKEPDSPFPRAHHRRSVSDSFACLEEAAETFTGCDESRFGFSHFRIPAISKNPIHYRGSSCVENKTTSLAEEYNQESAVVSTLKLEHSNESSLPNLEDSADKDVSSQAKPAGSKSDSKRKQHNAHRSRVRKLQYIAHLEKTVQMLRADGSGISAELEFLQQQTMILTMENRALKQRLESISQEQLIKQWEQGMLEREIARSQTLYHLQKQQQMHMQQQQQLKQRRNKSRDFGHPPISSGRKNEPSPSKSSVTGSTQA